MAVLKSMNSRLSRYRQGGKSTEHVDRLGWWERKLFPKHTSDVSFVLPAKYAANPGMLAYDVYGNANLEWLVLQYNNIINPHTEFVEGVTITLPTVNRTMTELLISK